MKAIISVCVSFFISFSMVHAEQRFSRLEGLLFQVEKNLEMDQPAEQSISVLETLSARDQELLREYAKNILDQNPVLAANAREIAGKIKKGEELTGSEAFYGIYKNVQFACADACLTLAVFAIGAVVLTYLLHPDGKVIRGQQNTIVVE